jgi:hypothetical protein
MNQRRGHFPARRVKAAFRKKRMLYAKLDLCACWTAGLRHPEGDHGLQDEIVTRLRDIKLEKTLIDASSEIVEDYVARCTNAIDLRLYLSGRACPSPRSRRCSPSSTPGAQSVVARKPWPDRGGSFSVKEMLSEVGDLDRRTG